MAYDQRKIANSFYLPKRPYLSGVSGLIDFTGSQTRYYTKQILERSDAEAMRADWEAVAASLWRAIRQHERNDKEEFSSG